MKHAAALLGCFMILFSGMPLCIGGHPGGDGAADGIYSLDVCQVSGATFPESTRVTCLIEKPVDIPAFILECPYEEVTSTVRIPVFHCSIDHPPRF